MWQSEIILQITDGIYRQVHFIFLTKSDFGFRREEMKLNEQNARFSYTYKKYDELYHNVAQKYGLSDTALWLLYLICREEEPCTQNYLAEELYIPKQTVNSAITKLARDGYVELVQRPGPRNSKAVCLTTYGQEQCAKYVVPLIEAENRAFARMTEDEQQLLLSLYEKRYQYMCEEVEILLK